MDFYFILGIGQDASQADIKRAFRRLSRRYHPGINPGDRAAEALFARITEAYETLSDPGRRRQYDAGGVNPAERSASGPSLQFTEFNFSSAAMGPQAATFAELFAEILHPIPATDRRPEAGVDIDAVLTIDFVSAIRGVERQVAVTRQVPCDACRGTGQLSAAEARCGQCQGAGSVRWARGHMVFSKVCPGCSGSGYQRVRSCAACGSSGRTVRGEGVAVQVPPGTSQGVRLRIPERGHAGHHGGRNGDLYVTIHVQPHPFFRRERDILCCVVPVAIHEAALGATIDVPTLDGRVRLQIPPGTQAGQRFRITGRGVPGPRGSRGDLEVEVKLVLPEVVDERSRDLMREFGQRNGADVRKDLFT